MKLVICNKAKQDEHCKKCFHSKPHEPYQMLDRSKPKCTFWGECSQPDFTTIKVRCTTIKEK
jgi:hypothetical protein